LIENEEFETLVTPYKKLLPCLGAQGSESGEDEVRDAIKLIDDQIISEDASKALLLEAGAE